MRIYLQRSAPIQPKTSEMLPKFCQKIATTARAPGGRPPRRAGPPTGCDGRVSLPRSRTTRNVHHTYQSFSSPTHRSPLCKFSIGPEKRKSAYYTHEPAVFYPESGRCTPRETDRENQMRGTLIVHALHLMNCRTTSTTKELESHLKSNVV